MLLRDRTIAAVACVGLAAAAHAALPSTIGDKCDVTGWNYYCQSAEGLARTYEYMVSLHNIRSGGATADTVRLIYASGCAFIPDGVRTVIRGVRVFHTKEDLATLVKVDFDGKQLIHEEDRYSREGEYMGQVSVSHTDGWMLRKDLSCPAKP